MKKVLVLFIVFNLNALNFICVDSLHDAVNGGGYVPIKAADTDNDGLPELIFASAVNYYKISFYERNPNGGFSLVHILPLYPSNEYTFIDVGIGDFDNDGKTDVFASHSNTPTYMEYFEVVESKNEYSHPDSIVFIDSLYIYSNNQQLDIWTGKFDFDDKEDIVIYKGDGEYDLLIYENEGDNSYVLKFHRDYTSGVPTDGGMAVGDLDQDGHPEIFITDLMDLIYPVKVFEAVGNDTIDTTSFNPFLFQSVGLWDVVFCGDVNNNGKPELMIHGPTPRPYTQTWRDDIWIIEATGDNQYELIWWDTIPGNLTWPDYGAVSSAGDLTGDGIPEIVLSMTQRVYVIQYIPGQGYTYVWQKGYPWNTADLATCVYDIDGDGLNEMILSVEYSLQNPWTYVYKKSPSVSEKYQRISPYFYVSKSITSDSLKIFYDLNTKNPSNFYIYNILGEKVYFKKLSSKGELNLNFKKLKLSPGIYFLKIDSEKIKKIEKIIYLKK